MTTEQALRGVLAGLLGAGIGWAANALTLAGRVDAIERGQARIEAQIERLIDQKREGKS